MKTKRLLISILLFLLIFSSNSHAQEYYYYDGNKIFVNWQQGRYVINFDSNLPTTKRKEILSSNNFIFNESNLSSEYVITESAKQEEEIKSIIDLKEILNITKVYSPIKMNSCEFTITNRIIFKTKQDISENEIFSIVATFQPEKIKFEWLGERVILLKISIIRGNSIFDIANQIYESDDELPARFLRGLVQSLFRPHPFSRDVSSVLQTHVF